MNELEQTQKVLAHVKKELELADTVIRAYQQFLKDEGYNVPFMSPAEQRAYVQSQWDLALR